MPLGQRVLPVLQQPRGGGMLNVVMLSVQRSGCSGDRAVTPARWHGDRGGLAMLQLTWGSFNFSFLGDC